MPDTLNGIPYEKKAVPCRYKEERGGCSDYAVGRYSVPNGCTCFPADREQDLCIQHAICAEPLGPFILVEIYDEERYDVLLELV